MRKLGRFTVAGYFFRDGNLCNGANLFKDMVILRVDHRLDSDDVEYLAAHPSFRMLPMGEMVPEYEAIFDNISIYPTWVEKSVS